MALKEHPLSPQTRRTFDHQARQEILGRTTPQGVKMMTTTEPTILDKEPSAQVVTQPHSQPSKTNTLPYSAHLMMRLRPSHEPQKNTLPLF